MALSNLNKETLNNLFTMLSLENIENNKILTQIRSDYSAYGKLSLIEKQINLLKLEAINIINEYNLNNEVNNIQCNFKKIPGNYYYIYSFVYILILILFYILYLQVIHNEYFLEL